jgi:hypothetical protein
MVGAGVHTAFAANAFVTNDPGSCALVALNGVYGAGGNAFWLLTLAADVGREWAVVCLGQDADACPGGPDGSFMLQRAKVLADATSGT